LNGAFFKGSQGYRGLADVLHEKRIPLDKVKAGLVKSGKLARE
jgi:hypothetical protein